MHHKCATNAPQKLAASRPRHGSVSTFDASLSPQVVHHRRGPAQKNAALALARVVKRPESLAQLKALHGLDILNSYLKT